MIAQNNTLLWFKLNGFLRYWLAHTATRYFPLYIVNEYPKSGGSWVADMLSVALGVPFPRNRLPMLRSSILHGHMMQSWNMHNVLLIWRDGRDILISQYFHSLFENERRNRRLVALCRADLGFSDYNDVKKNLPAFMEYVYEQKRHPRMSWAEFVRRWAGCDRCIHIKYENLRLTPDKELQRVILELSGRELNPAQIREIVEKFSFETISGRKIGEENARSFLRKGIVGDWRNYFDQVSRERFQSYAGDELIKLGYETGPDWVFQEVDQNSGVEL